MCIIIDTNVFPCVCDSKSTQRSEFEPVDKWLHNTKGAKFVYGGTKYRKELGKFTKALPYLTELKRSGHTAEIIDKLVDDAEKAISTQTVAKGCNDAHIIALVSISGCRLVCSNDCSSFEHIKNSRLYPKGIKPPKIYSSKKNIDLLCNKYIIIIHNQM